MRQVIEEQLTNIRAAAMEQENRIASELNSAVDGVNTAKTTYSAGMASVRALRQEAEKLEAAAREKRLEADQLEAATVRQLDTALENFQAINCGVVQQIADGRMVTGSNTPVIPKRKPKLVGGGES